MGKDRLDELNRLARKASTWHRPREYYGNVIRAEEPEKIQAFEKLHTDIDAISSDLDTLADVIRQVKSDYEKLIALPAVDFEIKTRLEQRTSSIRTLAKKLNGNLTELSKQKDHAESLSAAYGRSVDMQLKALQHRFVDLMSDHNSSQAAYRDACKKKIGRQLAIVNREIDSDELEALIDKYIEEGNVNVFTSDIFDGGEQAKATLAEVQLRHEQIKELEKSIRELAELFSEMAVLVHDQGATIDSIEANVLKSRDFLGNAHKNLHRAMLIQKSYRRKICYGIAALILLIIVIVFIVIFA